MSRLPSERPAARNGSSAPTAITKCLTTDSRRPLRWHLPARNAERCFGRTSSLSKSLMNTAPTAIISTCSMPSLKRINDRVMLYFSISATSLFKNKFEYFLNSLQLTPNHSQPLPHPQISCPLGGLSIHANYYYTYQYHTSWVRESLISCLICPSSEAITQEAADSSQLRKCKHFWG